MKKIISLCSVVLVFALMITVFTACGDNTEDNTTTQNSENAVVDTKGFSVEISEATAVVKKDGKEYQTLKYPINAGMPFDLDYAKKNNAFIDMNFDGEPDFYIAISNADGVISYYCWLYNATTKQFDYSVILSELKNISVDADYHRILSNVMVGGEEHVFCYRWVDGKLTFDTDYSDDNGGIPEEVTQVVNDNAIGSDKKPAEESDKNNNKKPDKNNNKKPDKNNGKEETTKNNTDSENNTTTKVNKPANTTTTAPHTNNGIVIETGSINDGWY